MYLKRSVSALLLSLAAFAGVYSQALSDSVQQAQPVAILRDTVSLRYFPRDTVWKDVIGMFNFIREYHPNMFMFTPAEVFDKRIYEMEYSLPDSMTAYQAYSFLAPVVALVGEGHTNMNIPRESYYKHNPYWLPEKPYIDKADMKLKLAEAPFEYSEIVSINGRPNREIVEQLLSYRGCETKHGQVACVNAMMPFIFPFVDSSSVFRVEYVSKEGGLQTVDLSGVRIKEHQRRVGVRDENGELKPEADTAHESNFKFSRTTHSTVVFSMPAFDDKHAPPVIDSLFAYITSEPGVENLIIDLRGNLGGIASVITLLLECLSPVEFHDYGNTFDFDMLDSVKIWKPKTASPHPPEKRFHNDLYVLIDNLSSSASVLFSHMVQRYKLGTLIGEQTGGTVFLCGAPISAKTFWGMELNCSTMILWVPALEHYRQTMEPVYPDIEVPSAEALDKALEIIASQDDKARR